MTKRQSKKRTLLASIISMILCVSMLLGTTMAWFTDSVYNTGNRIVTGGLGVELLRHDGTSYEIISDGVGDIFTTENQPDTKEWPLNGILWEPGKTEVVLLQVANTGNLALNYNIILDVRYEGEAPLEEALSYAVIPNVGEGDGLPGNVLKYSDMTITGWKSIADLPGIDTGVVKSGITQAAPKGALLAGNSDYFALAVHMNEDAGNLYQYQEILIDVKVEAKQMPSEYDSFGNQYDAAAEYYNEEYMDALTYHVSTDGDDSNPGTKDKPFATVAKANEVISAMEQKDSHVLVLIHGGTYFMSGDTVFSGAEAGGSGDNKVVYKAAGDGEVVFSGFIDIPVSTAVSADGTTVGELTSEKVQQELLKFDLSSYGLDATQFEFTRNDDGEYQDRVTTPGDTVERFTLLLNGKEQIIASWPNYGEYEVIKEVVNEGGGNSTDEGAVFKYTYSNIDNWSEASLREALVKGYLSANYREEWNGVASVDSENKEITLRWGTEFRVKIGRDWRILNIAEEIDVPGEYCIDWEHSDLALYYYPTYELSSDDCLQLSATRGASWICENTKNIVFDGIKFTGIRNSDKEQGVITVKNSDNIEIRNCTFTYNDGGANIVITGENNIVEACGFYNCGAAGVFLYGGGDYTTLARQNNAVINNHFYNSGNSNLQGIGGAVTNNATSWYTKDTVGNTINNNLIHHIHGAMNICLNGIEYDVSYNEISNGLRNLADYGLIYTGAKPQTQGMTINYNYLHDFGSLKDFSSSVYGIYIDDWNSGHTANNNIVVANSDAQTTGISSVGAYNTFKYNIVANSVKGVSQGSRSNLVGEHSTLTNFVNNISGMSDAWKTKYPFMLDLQRAAINGQPFPVMNNVITDNIAYNAAYSIADNAVTLGTIENNVTVTDTEGVFVDPQNHDWRITSEYAAANNLNENIITEANFDMDQIGIQKDVWNISNPKDSFKQVYPKNGSADVQPNDVVLNWEQALFADEYKYVVAKDAALTDVVASGTTVYEHINIGKLEPEKTYYWKITAVNTTKQLGASWDSEKVFSFTTDIERADKYELVQAIAVATESFAQVEDGAENKVGDYKIGTEEKLQKLLDNANATNENERATQAEVDEMTAKLTNAVNGPSAYKYKGYVTLDTSDASKWNSTNANTTFAVENGVMSVTGTKVVTYTENIPNHNMITFDVNADFSNSKMLGFMVRSTDRTAADVYRGKCYFFWITENKIELQAESDVGDHIVIYPEDADKGVIFPNNYIESNTWHTIRIETIDLEGGGIKIILYVDGEEVLSQVDTTYLRYEEGTFAVQCTGGSVQIRAVEEMPAFEDVEIVDKSELVSAIAAATVNFALVKDGEENVVGDYKVGTEAKLQELLDTANAVNAKEKTTQAEVDEITAKLTTAIEAVGTTAYKYKGYVKLDTSNVNNWKRCTAATPISVEDGILTVNGTHCVSYAETLPNYNMVTFDAKLDLSSGYLGIVMRDGMTLGTNGHYNSFTGDSYFFQIYNNKVYLQSDPLGGGVQEILASKTGEFMKSNEWANIRVEAIDLEEGGVKLVLYINNEEILSHTDTKFLRYTEGKFAVQSYSTVGLQIRTASELPTFAN